MSFLCSCLQNGQYYVQGYPPLNKRTYYPENAEGRTRNEPMRYQEANIQNGGLPSPGFAPENSLVLDPTFSDAIISPKTSKTTNNSKFKISPQQYYTQFKRQFNEKLPSQAVPSLLLQLGKLQDKQCVFNMIKKSQYESLKSNYKNAKWVDPVFGQQKTYKVHNGDPIELTWLNLHEIFKERQDKKVALFEDGIRTTDIIQGKIGDCYFLSAIAALAKYPERILAIFPEEKINQKGIYMARMVFKGIKQEIIVDENLPTFIKDKEYQLLGCKPSVNSYEIYTLILEKCWAKLWKSYERIDGGYPHQALHALTGAVTKNYFLKNQCNPPEKSKSFFNRVLNFQKGEFVMCAGTSPLHQNSKKEIIDIQPSHIYCVEKVIVENGKKKVKIYNPWGHNKINGKLIGGQAYLSWQDFTTEFQYLTVCKVYNNAHYLYQEMDFGPREFKFIELDIYERTARYLAVTVSETDKKEEENTYNPYLNLTYIVLKEVKGEKGKYELLVIKNSSKFSEHYMELVDLQVGKYLIAIYISNPEIKEKLTFAVYSQATFGFSQKKVDSAFRKSFPHTVMHAYDKQLSSDSETRKNIDHGGNAWVSFNMMINKSCFGYFLVHVGQQAKNGYQVKLGTKQFSEAGMRILPPNDQQSIQMQVMPANEALIVVVIDDPKRYKGYNFETLAKLHAHIGFKSKSIPL